jgi:cytoskeletal protein CcmA (bactofilin family)
MAVRKSTVEAFDDGVTVIGEGIQIRGRIEGEEDLRVHGSIEGSISLTETLYVEDGGVVQATVEARDVVVSGIVIGDVIAGNSITLNAGAKLVGNIKSPRVIIADGAAFRGDVSMGDTPISTLVRSSVATAARRGSRGANRSAPSTAPARSAPAPARAGSRAVEPAKAAKARPAQRPSRSSDDEDEVTVVIKHAALRKGQAPPDEDEPVRKAKPKARAAAPKKKAKKKAARARVPARGKRRVSRR